MTTELEALATRLVTLEDQISALKDEARKAGLLIREVTDMAFVKRHKSEPVRRAARLNQAARKAKRDIPIGEHEIMARRLAGANVNLADQKAVVLWLDAQPRTRSLRGWSDVILSRARHLRADPP